MGRYIKVTKTLDERVAWEKEQQERKEEILKQKYADRGKEEKEKRNPSLSEKVDKRVEDAFEGKKVSMSKVLGQRRRGKSELQMARSRHQADMIAMFLNPEYAMDYYAIAREINDKLREEGYDVSVTKSMVQADIKEAMKGQILKSEADKEAVFVAAGEALKDIIRKSMDDYEKSKSVDAKSEASMLRTLIKDAGMTYDEAMMEIQRKRYAGNPDHLRVQMDAMERYAGMFGLSIKGASVSMQNGSGNQNQSGNIVNYNFDGVDKDKMKELVKALQDNKFESIQNGEVDEQRPTVTEEMILEDE